MLHINSFSFTIGQLDCTDPAAPKQSYFGGHIFQLPVLQTSKIVVQSIDAKKEAMWMRVTEICNGSQPASRAASEMTPSLLTTGGGLTVGSAPSSDPGPVTSLSGPLPGGKSSLGV